LPADAPAAAIAPFNAEQAKTHQEAWAKYLGAPAEFTDKHGTKYVLIPPGEFQMGFSQPELDTLTRELKQAGASEYDLFSASTSAPQHTVRITKPFYMSAHEVTVA
jgi:formylglycine-generating enzyme required for sulfatase activity